MLRPWALAAINRSQASGIELYGVTLDRVRAKISSYYSDVILDSYQLFMM